MKKQNLFLLTGLFLITLEAFAETKSFIISKDHKVIEQEGDTELRHPPRCSAKIALSLAGYDSGILIDETHPVWPFDKNYVSGFSVTTWEQSHNPTMWLKHSCVWYSRVLMENLGLEKFKQYLTKFNYGNMDIPVGEYPRNGYFGYWLANSLKISPKEQIEFIYKFLEKKLPVSKKSYEMTKKILFIEELPNGWKFYGKTGCGCVFAKDEPGYDPLNHLGWFVGWAEKGDQQILVAHYCEDREEDYLSGRRARDLAKEKLIKLIETGLN